MRLKREFYKLPVRFDVARMVEEVNGFSEEEWREHPQKYPGNTAMVLISVRGELNDEIAGPMAVTEKLSRCPYLQQVLASFNTVFGRSRLMRLAPGAEVPTHNDVHYYWRNRVRIHIPIITDPAVRFFCGKQSVHMAAAEAWIFDSWKPHSVVNPAAHHRIHLVADTVGTAAFWDTVRVLHLAGHRQPETRYVAFHPEFSPELRLERYNQPVVMPPAELDAALREMIVDLRSNRRLDPSECGAFVQVLDDLRHEWQSLWVQHGPGESGWKDYRDQLQRARSRIAESPRTLTLSSTGFMAQFVAIAGGQDIERMADQVNDMGRRKHQRQDSQVNFVERHLVGEAAHARVEYGDRADFSQVIIAETLQGLAMFRLRQ